MIRINGGQATLDANTFTGAQVAPSLAIGGATIGSNALAVTGTTLFTGNVDSTGYTNTSTAFKATAGGSFYWSTRSLMASPSDGVIKFSNNGQTDFTRLQFGGTTSSFPAIKRNAAAFDLRLADDSGYASFTAATGTFSADIAASGTILAWQSTAIPAGGTAGVGIRFSSTSNFGMFFGSGTPTLSAAKGSLYLRSDGTGVADRMYVNTDGSTTWTAVTTVA